jgi:phosphoribosyl-ATP pyrophosphohydrolase
MSKHIFDALFSVIEERHASMTEESYTTKLFSAGVPKIAQKVGEEAVETVIEAMRGDKALLVEESADLLFHLMVLWQACGVKPDDVWQVMQARRSKKSFSNEP